jgi:uracil-DNA glycosylase family 4
MSPDERQTLIRSVRQRLESLARAGVDRIALPDVLPTAPRKSRPKVETPVLTPIAVATPPAPIRTAPIVTASLFEEPTIDEPMLAPGDRPAALATLASEVSVCVRCPQLATSRTQTVFGTGSPTARLMFIGEAPGADEDRTGQPFVGRAGALLTDMITKGMGLTRDEVYIANILKSRPPENRTPLPDEVAHCLPYLERQLAIIRPEFLCLLGKTAVSALLETSLPMNRLRGRWHRYRGIPTVVTWHPAYLLRNPAAKRETWDDLQLLMLAMGLKVPDRKKPD